MPTKWVKKILYIRFGSFKRQEIAGTPLSSLDYNITGNSKCERLKIKEIGKSASEPLSLRI